MQGIPLLHTLHQGHHPVVHNLPSVRVIPDSSPSHSSHDQIKLESLEPPISDPNSALLHPNFRFVNSSSFNFKFTQWIMKSYFILQEFWGYLIIFHFSILPWTDQNLQRAHQIQIDMTFTLTAFKEDQFYQLCIPGTLIGLLPHLTFDWN